MQRAPLRPIPQPEDCLAGGGQMGALMRRTNWRSTPLGPVSGWPQSLRTTVSTCLGSRFPILVWWGTELVKLYNDAYAPILGNKHPQALGRPGKEIWPEIWDIIGPMLVGVMESGEATWSENLMLPLERRGFAEECYFTFSYSPIRDESGRVAGVFTAVTETTSQVLGERRLLALRELGARAAEAKTVTESCENAVSVLADAPADVPFALLYLFDAKRERLELAARAGLHQDDRAAPRVIDLGKDGESGWPVSEAIGSPRARTIDDLHSRFGAMPGGTHPEPAKTALALALGRPGHVSYGVLIAGVSPRSLLDEQYRTFYELAAEHITTAIANARAYEEERQRAEALADLDRAKTAFFSNVSHEFRTPLTLLLGPLEELLGDPGLGPHYRDTVRLVQRNALRLLKLVNSLLDFAQVESGRVRACYERVDLPRYTAELASTFESAMQKAGLEYRVDCEPLEEAVYVDREMWEKVVLNLISNAFKFTTNGSVTVSLRQREGGSELSVADTGCGISEGDLPKVFDRFHRAEGAASRTHEGSGIGLALVRDLVELHGGTIEAESTEGKGSVFRVWLPFGSEHLPSDRISDEGPFVSTPSSAAIYNEEALRWLPDDEGSNKQSQEQAAAGVPPKILLAEDNADLRQYVARMLEGQFRVEAVADGGTALEVARARPPDLVVTDVMMPGLDGFGLLDRLRNDPVTTHVPVIMLSARAGEEPRAVGLEAGADDYLVKPFSGKELVARVRTLLTVARSRRMAAEADKKKEQFLAVLGHELRNPLAPIRTALEVMKLRGSRELVDERAVIERQVEHMTQLVDDLLDVSRVLRGKLRLRRRPIELSRVVGRAVEIASPLLEERGHRLTVRVPPSGLRIEADETRLSQVFSNLLTNAAKYTEPGGDIEITAVRNGARVVVRVRDNGVGIAPDLLPTIFEPFVQGVRADAEIQGSLGLGLPLVKGLVTLHGGTVSVVSDGPGCGTEFCVDLPTLSTQMLALRPPEQAMARSLPEAAHRVLVVDDNVDAAEMLSELLKAAGHNVEIAYDGPEALAKARTFQPTAALLDIGLPAMDGYELARRMRAQQPNELTLIAITGYGQERDRALSREAGFDAHLVKPVELRTLLDALP